MNILGSGIDLIEISRVAAVYERKGKRFLDKVFAPGEQNAIFSGRSTKSVLEKMAGRWAAKEAVMKALGTGWRKGVAWREIVIEHLPSGKPVVRLLGKTASIAHAKGIDRLEISMSHDNQTAVAQALALGGDHSESSNE